MKIVNLKEFLYLPAGTVFAEFYPADFGELRIKGENEGARDFFYQNLLEVEGVQGEDASLTMIKRMEDGKSFSLDLDSPELETQHESFQLFAVFERKDLGQLIHTLCDAYKRSEHPDQGWEEFDKTVAQLQLGD